MALITRRRGLLLATPALILPHRARAQLGTLMGVGGPASSGAQSIAVSTPAGGAPSGTLGLSGTYGGAFTGTQIDYYWSTSNGSPTGGSWVTGIAASPSGGTWATGGSAVSYPSSAATYYLFVRETSATSVVSSASGSVVVSVPGYQGPGDIVSGAFSFYSTIRAYNAAYAGGSAGLFGPPT